MDQNTALDKLRDICSRQEKAPADIANLLRKWDVSPAVLPDIIATLKREKFIDEKRYATAFTRDKIRFDHWGFIKIRMMLQQKGIERKTIDEVISNTDRNEYRTMIGQELAKKRRTLKGTPYEIWAKLARYGSSRGYEMNDMQEFLGTAGE
jgi:regulatory protein